MRTFCSTISTVMPSRAMRPMMRKMSSTICGASAALGSSSMIIFGSDIRPRPMHSICSWPPDSVAASWRRRSLSTGK